MSARPRWGALVAGAVVGCIAGPIIVLAPAPWPAVIVGVYVVVAAAFLWVTRP